MSDTDDFLDSLNPGSGGQFSGRHQRPPLNRKTPPFFAIGVAIAIAVAIIFGIILLQTVGPRNASRDVPKGKPPTSAQTIQLFVVHLGDKPDFYFNGFIGSNNRIGVEMDWTTKANAKRFTASDAKATVDGIQKLARQANLYAPVQIEPAE